MNTSQQRKRGLGQGLLLASLFVTLMLGLVAPKAALTAGPEPEERNTTGDYRVDNVSTREARTAVARTGADIIEVGADYVTIRATPREVRLLTRRGFTVEPLSLTTEPAAHTVELEPLMTMAITPCPACAPVMEP